MSDFTFYADLVGISSLYATSPHQAYKKLSEYYTEVFIGLEPYYRVSASRRVEMYSDSLVVSGDNLRDFLVALAPLYMQLLSKGLMPRGGIAAGRLNFDMRITTENFRQNLPDSDVLARCVGLERKVKGARIVIESGLVNPYFNQCQEWVTLHGYLSDPKLGNRDFVLQRSIVPLPDGSAFEILYPIIGAAGDFLESRKSELDYMIGALPKEMSAHHYETKRLLEHSQRRLKDQRG